MKTQGFSSQGDGINCLLFLHLPPNLCTVAPAALSATATARILLLLRGKEFILTVSRPSTALTHLPRRRGGAEEAGGDQSEESGSRPGVGADSLPTLTRPLDQSAGRCRQPTLERLALLWTREDSIEPADVLVVLAGDSAAGGRLQRAVELYRQGLAPILILSGPPFRRYLNESQLMEQEARQIGVPQKALLQVPHTGASTLEEASYLLRAAAEAGARSLIVVSSNFHVRRVRAIYRALARRGGFSVCVATADDLRFDPAGWWKGRLGIVTIGLELLKSVLTWIELRKLAWRRSPAVEPFKPDSTSQEATGWTHFRSSHR